MDAIPHDPAADAPLRRIGVVGMGIMGSPMALCLLRAGYDVGVFNRSPEKCEAARAAGATVAASAAELAAKSDALIAMLADDASCEAVLLGPRGALEGARTGLVVINSSTVDPRTNVRLAGNFSRRGIAFIDAPVTGSRPQAETGALYFLVGGDERTYRRCTPLFEAMGRGHIHLGPLGSGACAKLGNNMMGFINLVGLSEALAIATRYGLSPEKFLQAIANSGGRSAISEAKGPKILREDWAADFALALAAKDMRLAGDLAASLRQHAPVLAQAAKILARAAREYGIDDVCSVARWYATRPPETE